MDEYRAPVPDIVPGATIMRLADMRELVERGGAVLIDVLPAPRRPDGMRPGTPWLPLRHRTLPGSLWWPEVGRGGLAPEVEAKFQARLAQVAAPNRLVVFFCLNDCWMSWNAAKRAASYGIRAAWYPEGVDGWEVAGLPLQDAAPEAFD